MIQVPQRLFVVFTAFVLAFPVGATFFSGVICVGLSGGASFEANGCSCEGHASEPSGHNSFAIGNNGLTILEGAASDSCFDVPVGHDADVIRRVTSRSVQPDDRSALPHRIVRGWHVDSRVGALGFPGNSPAAARAIQQLSLPLRI